MFMQDSARAAYIASENEVEVGLHLNFTTMFSGRDVPTGVVEHQRRTATYLLQHRFAQIVFHPGLRQSFEYVVKAQIDEFERRYRRAPQRIDGHHHMHLCANVLLAGLLPPGTIIRRNFSFQRGEKSRLNLIYRRAVDQMLARSHYVTDLFFSLTPLDPVGRLRFIASQAKRNVIEVETHPINPDEYQFLSDGSNAEDLEEAHISDGSAWGGLCRWSDSRRVTLSPPPAYHLVPDDGPDGSIKHISVCVCTYKRPTLLKKLLLMLADQNTEGLFTYAIIVADNDQLGSAASIVQEVSAGTKVKIRYCLEPRQNIALARNRAVENSHGEFLAFIDDDEFPIKDWLLELFKTCERYGVAGVLGPVKRHFDEKPPEWMARSSFYERADHPTGFVLGWREARTGNVLLRRELFADGMDPFRPEFRAGEDQDFFRRKMDQGLVFIWCNDAVVHEAVPPIRWKRTYMLRRALLRGDTAIRHPSFGLTDVAKSVVAVIIYTLALPVAMIAGHHRFMTLLVRLFDHVGKLLALLNMNPIKEPYVTE
jgi:succinoglycan biosynthesis protein ExoM